MVLLPGCQCCGEDNCGCMPPYPDFIDVEASFTTSASSGVLESVLTSFRGGVWDYAPPNTIYVNNVDDVWRTTLTASGAEPYSNRTFRLTGDKNALNTSGGPVQGTISYIFTESGNQGPFLGGGLWADLSISMPPSASPYTAEKQCGLTWSLRAIGHGTYSVVTTRTSTISFRPGFEVYPMYSGRFVGTGGVVSVECKANLDSFPYQTVLGPPIRTQTSLVGAVAEACDGSNNCDFVRSGDAYYGVQTQSSCIGNCTVARSFSGTDNSVWPFQASFRNRYGIPKTNPYDPPNAINRDGGAVKDIIVNTNNGFTECASTEFLNYYCVDFTFTIHSVKFWYGETAVDFPSKTVYGAAPSASY